MSNNNNVDTEVEFEYTGSGCLVPKDVTIVRFHRSVVEVEKRAFRDCKQLRKITFNEGLQKIGVSAFLNCTSLLSITFPSTVIEIGQCAFGNSLREVVLNERLQKIGFGAFYKCTSLSSITLPSTVTEIGGYAFSNCNLREVVFHEGMQKIGNCVFQLCHSLESVKLPSTVTEIGGYAFHYCSNLREVMFNGIPREIGQYAFINCTSLERFTFPTISSRLDNLIHTGHWEEIENEVDEVRGVVERSGGEMFVSAQTMGGGRTWNAVRRDLEKMIGLISYYELKEATSIFELALWKFKLGQVDEADPIPRKNCRMDVPGPVKDIILTYLR